MEYLQLWFGTNFGNLFEEVIENFWELEREREREELGNIVGNIRDISGKPFLVGNKMKFMCWDLRMGGQGTKNAKFNTSSFTLVAMHHSLRVYIY
jgi:hypothetical protein